MPLTPHFELSQTSSEVIVLVFVKTIRLESIEVLLDDDSVLHFHAHPYSLTLNFAPCQFDAEAQGIVSAQYDPSLGQIRIPIIKADKGQTWPNLDMTARLMLPKEIPKQWLHAVVDSKENQDSANDTSHTEESTDTKPLKTTSLLQESSFSSSYGYGFGNLFQNIFTDYCRSGIAQEMLSLQDPENTEPSERRSQRIDQEQQDFDPDRYDYEIPEDDYLYDMVRNFVPFWKHQQTDNSHHAENLAKSLETKLHITTDKIAPSDSPEQESSSRSHFTADEKLQLSTIPYPLIPDNLLVRNTSDSAEPLWCGLLDLLIPYAYDHLMTMGDPTVESAWTITKLSCSLSWLDPPTTIQEAIIGSTRRLLIYPYWRNLDFALTVWDHSVSILESSDALYLIVKCLLQIRSILEKSEFYYAGNKIFVDPYLYWVQHQDGSELKSVARKIRNELGKGSLKEDVDLDLTIYENLVFGEEEEDEEDSSDDDTTSSSEDSDSEEEEEVDEDDSRTGSDSKAGGHHEVAQSRETTEKAESIKVSSTLLELEHDQAPRPLVLSVVNEPSTTSSAKGKFLIEEMN